MVKWYLMLVRFDKLNERITYPCRIYSGLCAAGYDLADILGIIALFLTLPDYKILLKFQQFRKNKGFK